MNTAQDAEIFHLGPTRRKILLFCAAIFFAGPVVLAVSGAVSGDQNVATAGYIVTALLLPFAGFFYFMANYPRLLLDSTGVTVRGTIGFSTYSVPWSNVDKLRVNPGSEAVILREPMDGKAARTLRSFAGVRFNGVEYYDREQQQLIAECRYMPIEAFGWWFEQGRLLTALKRFAPGLVDTFEADRKATAGARKAARRAIWWVFAVSAAILTVTAFFALNEDKIPEASKKSIASGTDLVFAWLSLLGGLAFVIYGIVNIRAAYYHIKLREPWLALLWLFAGVMQILLSLLLFAIWIEQGF